MIETAFVYIRDCFRLKTKIVEQIINGGRYSVLPNKGELSQCAIIIQAENMLEKWYKQCRKNNR